MNLHKMVYHKWHEYNLLPRLIFWDFLSRL